MSLGILGQYGSDSNSSISDSDDDNGKDILHTKELEHSTLGIGGGKGVAPPPICADPLSLINKRNSDTDSDSCDSPPPPPPHETMFTPLPLPDIDIVVAKNSSYSSSKLLVGSESDHLGPSPQDGGGLVEETSVFFNPYKKAEEEKLAMLKRHVSEFDKKPDIKARSFRNRSWCYDQRNPIEQGKDTNRSSSALIPPPNTSAHRTTSHVTRVPESTWPLEEGDNELFDENDSSTSIKKRKHRSGVKNSLVPPKKFLKMHEKIQSKERPWRMKR